ncbi:melatonin receptor type 1C-like [Acanthaster planci]|uniref:Melatonin receptor type 1C-like n=1 Tax=Acanthaster planci TaxID=133434 RepID=A0A8B7ZWI9_ACAPL|nr:melatonin receptor type 1C-like [Acanthaster planci]
MDEHKDNLTHNSSGCLEEVCTSYSERQVFAAIFGIIFVVGTVGNALVIAAVILSRKLRNATNMLVLNLSIADFLTCVCVIPINAAAILSEDSWPLVNSSCKFAGFLLAVCTGCSLNNLACIAINRYVMITKSKSTYRTMFNRRRTLAGVILTWLVPLAVVICPALTGIVEIAFNLDASLCTWLSLYPEHLHAYPFNFIFFALSVPIQVSLIFLSYISILCHIRTHTKRVRPDSNLQIQVTKNLALVMCVFMLCYVPSCIKLLLSSPMPMWFRRASFAIFLANSCVNPLIYAAKHPNFRVVFCCIIRGKWKDIPERVSFQFCK